MSKIGSHITWAKSQRVSPILEGGMAVTTEIAPDIYRISIFAQSGNLQFNHFLVKDHDPMLFRTWPRVHNADVCKCDGLCAHRGTQHFCCDQSA